MTASWRRWLVLVSVSSPVNVYPRVTGPVKRTAMLWFKLEYCNWLIYYHKHNTNNYACCDGCVFIMTRVIDIANPSVCPSVRHVHFSILWKRLKILSQFLHRTVRSPIILVLWVSNIFAKFRRARFPLQTVAKCRWGINSLRFSTNKSLYHANDTR